MNDSVTCSQCGIQRHIELTQMSARPPCESCGATTLKMDASANASVRASMYAAGELIPGKQARDWEMRWSLIQHDLQHLLSPSTADTSSDAIHQCLHRLTSFFIQCFHLKEAIKIAAPSLGLTRSNVEKAFNADVRLALLADLANLDKHMALTSEPKSGAVPVYDRISGVDQMAGGWLLSARIKHGALTLDGLTVAKDAVDGWRSLLTQWQIPATALSVE